MFDTNLSMVRSSLRPLFIRRRTRVGFLVIGVRLCYKNASSSLAIFVEVKVSAGYTIIREGVYYEI